MQSQKMFPKSYHVAVITKACVYPSHLDEPNRPKVVAIGAARISDFGHDEEGYKGEEGVGKGG
jgi:hypothetical protein